MRRLDSGRVGPIVTVMRLSHKELRHLIEAEVDKMRLPRGPNSRDDGDDEELDELHETALDGPDRGFGDRPNFDNLDVHGELVAAGELIDEAVRRMKNALKADKWQGGTLDSTVRSTIEKMMNKLVDDEYAATLMSGK